VVDLFQQAKEIVLEAGIMLLNAFSEEKKVSTKSIHYDLVTETDKGIEAFLIERLKTVCPGSKFLAEESDAQHKTAEKLWIIDPIDGTTNFVHKFPFSCISVAYMLHGQLKYGYVYNPMMNEFYTAQRGKGAYLNDHKICVSGESDFSKTFLATGFFYDFTNAKVDNVSVFRSMLSQVHAIRRAGSAALDLCYVAKGVFDGYWEFYLNPWDVCAGILIVQEAGGTVTGSALKEWSFSDELIVASNGAIHQELFNQINSITQKK